MDAFSEKIVTRKKNFKDSFLAFGIVIAAVILIFICMNIEVLRSLSLFIVVGAVYLSFRLITTRNIEYEYIVTNGELDIDQITAQRKRKRIFSANSREFDTMAKYNAHGANTQFQNMSKRIEAVSSMDSNEIYYFTLNYKGGRTVVFFEPNEKMLSMFKAAIPRKVQF